MSHLTDTDANLEAALRSSRVLLDAPESVIRRAIDVFVPFASKPAQPPLLRRLAAVLSFDSRSAGAIPAGVRGATDGSIRQLLFCADGRDVDLRIAPAETGPGFSIGGQVLGPDTAGSALFHSGDLRIEVPWNEWSEFRIDAVPPGPARLTLRADDWELELPELQIP
jgi:hypothetical protein